jgi:hypothetical protein
VTLVSYKKQDKLFTFVQRWRLLTLAKAFNKWKELIQIPKEERKLQESQDSEDAKVEELPYDC